MEVIGGGLEEGRVIFKGLRNDHLVTTDKTEKNLLIKYRKLNRSGREKCVLDAEWILNNPRTFRRKKNPRTSRKAQKEKNAQRLKHKEQDIG